MHVSEIIRCAIELGKREGRITFDELNELCPGNTVEPEDIERIIQALSDAEIRLEEEWCKIGVFGANATDQRFNGVVPANEGTYLWYLPPASFSQAGHRPQSRSGLPSAVTSRERFDRQNSGGHCREIARSHPHEAATVFRRDIDHSREAMLSQSLMHDNHRTTLKCHNGCAPGDHAQEQQ